MGSYTFLFRTYTISRYSVAALLGSVETDSRLLDLNVLAPLELSHKVVREYAKQSRVIIAYSVMSTQTGPVYDEVKSVRKEFGNDVIIVGGGAHASSRPRDLLDNGFDYVVIGEGEKALCDLLWFLMNDKDPSEIDTVVSITTDQFPLPRNLPRVVLDEYPPFALEMNVVGPVEVTRGCPFACKFCSTPFLTGSRVQHRSVDSVVKWLKLAVEKRGFKRTWFLSPNALCYGGRGRKAVPEKLEQLLRGVTSINGLDEIFFGAFPSEVRPEFVTNDLLKMMREYVSNKTLQIGLQSGSNRVLEIANRHHTVEEGLDAVRTALDCGFIPHVDMIFGLPGEEQKDVDTSIELCYSLVKMGARVHGHVFMPLPGSAFENMPPGTLDSETRRILGELSRKKQLTGSWSAQEGWAEKLASEK
ncbi:MAG: TIGR04013 family B12-binding domain/radical SAM domain-containing protein [Candidatus Thorarchaeota archaeon]